METHPNESQAEADSMQDDYDFRQMRGVVRGKYAERFRAQEPTVRIFRTDGTTDEGTLSEMRKKYDAEAGSPWTVFDYEVQQFFAMVTLLSSENRGDDHFTSHVRNAIVESAVLHSRQLADIILSRGKESDDINLTQLLPNYDSDHLRELADIFGDRRTEGSACWVINKHLAHATAHRSRSFDYSVLLQQLVPILQRIVNDVTSLRSNV